MGLQTVSVTTFTHRCDRCDYTLSVTEQDLQGWNYIYAARDMHNLYLCPQCILEFEGWKIEGKPILDQSAT